VTLTNVTISGNSSASGGGITGLALLYNTILANSLSGGNCSIVLGGVANLSNDATCGFGAGRDGVSALLLPLGNYDGSTQTMVPLPASSSIDFANDAACPTTDQRSLPRPAGPHCAVGAVERQALDYPLIYLPLIYR
jgi:hypothetical protein